MTEANAAKTEAMPCPKCGKRIVPGNVNNRVIADSIDPLDCNCNEMHLDAQMSARFSALRQAGEGTLFLTAGQTQSPSDNMSIGLAPGAVIGGVYEIIGLLGRGGMGEVYLAKHLTLNKRCALKVIPPDQVTDQSWQRFQFEAKTVAKMDHVNLVRVTDLGIHEQCLPFYAMEYLEGKNLAEMLMDFGPMPLVKAVEVFVQVCDGLDLAHRNAILHRDLKPANIMLTRTPTGKLEVKVLDFGLAKLTVHDRSKQSLTAVGDVFGSPSYMSPEQCANETLDSRSDIYSIGCTLFESLTGRPPFNSDIPGAVFFGHLESEPPSLNSAMPEGQSVPPKMEAIMGKLLRKNPDERYQTLSQLKADLLPLLGPGKGNKDSQSITAGKKAASPARIESAVATRAGPSSDPRSGSSVRAPVKNPQYAQDKKENRTNNKKSPDILKTLLLFSSIVMVALTGGSLILFFNLPKEKPTVAPALIKSTAAPVDQLEQISISPSGLPEIDAFNSHDRPDFDTVSKTFTSKTNMQNPNKNPPWDGKKAYRGIVVQGNARYRKFVFPKLERGCSYFEYGVWPTLKQVALSQEVLIPVGQHVCFQPVAYIATQPFMLNGLSDGDFDAIGLMERDPFAFSTALGVLSKFKSVTSIRFGDKASWELEYPLSGDRVGPMLNQYPNLEKVTIGAPISHLYLNQITRLKQLKELRLLGPQKDLLSCLMVISQCPNLESLAVSKWTIAPNQLSALKTCTHLRRLFIGILTGSHEQLALIGNLHQLNILEMPLLKYRLDLAADIKKLPALKELRFRPFDWSPDQVKMLQNDLPGIKLTFYRSPEDVANSLRQP